MTRKYYPFEDYKIAKLKQDNNKKALTVDDFRKFRDVDLSSRPDLVDSHNYFMFSVYARGMNFVDEMKLQWTDIQNERISYKRSKTRHSFNIEINEKMAEIIDYYRSKRTDSHYVFPILLKNDLTPTQIANRRQKVLFRYNKQLKEIAKNGNPADLQGVELIYQKFKSKLVEKGLKLVEVKPGDDFDVNLHEAITQIPAPTEDLKGKIVDVIETGYQLHDKVIRFAKVVIGN